jgi:hypothetical protein
MATILGIPLVLGQDEYFESQGEALGRPAMRECASGALAQARELVAPALVYDWFSVGDRDERQAAVGGVVFRIGKHADLLRPALSAFLAVVTIGPALEERSRELQASGKALDAFMLDQAGVYVVGKLIELAHSVVEEDAAGRGWRVGAELAPGQLSGWAIAEQKLVGQLVDLMSIGVRVTDSGMLVPQKSASLMVGVGPDYSASKVLSPCEFCEMRETCRYSH